MDLSQCISVNIVTRLRAGRPWFDSRQGQGLLGTTASRLALGLIQLPVQCVLGVSSPGGKTAGAWSWLLTYI